MLWHLRMLLEGMAEDADRKVGQIEILSESEKAQILSEWNDTQVAYPGENRVHELFEQQVEKTPDAIALVCEGEQIDYRELNRRANQLAWHLKHQSVKPETVIGVYLERSIEMVVTFLAVLKSGGAYLPLDPSYSSERLAIMVEDSRAEMIISQMKMPKIPAQVTVKQIVLNEEREIIAEQRCENVKAEVTGENLAYLIYTSGSAGRPKGVMGLHQGLVNRLEWVWKECGFEEGEVCCQRTALNLVDSIWEIFGGLLRGIRTVIIEKKKANDVERLVEDLERERVTRIAMAPWLLETMVEGVTGLERKLEKLNIIVVSGECLGGNVARSYKKKLGGKRLLYGSAEIPADVCGYEVREKYGERRSVLIGRGMSNTGIYILDDKLEVLPVGVSGSIYVSGDGLARGYINRGDLTAEKLIPNPYSDESKNRLYRTGSFGRWLNDGSIEYIGRAGGQAKVRGYSDGVGEFETALLEYGGMRQCAVEWQGEEVGDQRLIAKQRLILSEELARRLNELSRREEVTLFTTMLVGFHLLLARYMGQKDIAVGTPVSGRNRDEIEGLISLFVDPVVLRTNLSDNPTLRELLRQSRRTELGADAHQDVPFEKLVEELQPDRNLDRHPFFEILFNYISVPSSTDVLPERVLDRLDVIRAESKFPMTVYIWGDHRQITLRINYRQPVFSSEQISVMLDQYRELLSQMVERPDEAIASYSLLTSQARQLLPDPGEELPEPGFELVTEMFNSWAGGFPGRIAVTQGGAEWSYEELAECAHRLARVLIGRGLKPGQTVMVCGEKSFGMIASLLAVSLSGGVLFTLDRKPTTARQRAMCEIAEVKCILFVGIEEQIEGWRLENCHADTLMVDPGSGSVVSHPVQADSQESSDSYRSISLPKLSPTDPAYIFFTSGTTGVPKGVLGRHKGLSHFLTWQREEFAISPSDRIAQLTGLSFDAVLRDIFLPLTSGATLCLPEEEIASGRTIAWLDRARISVLHTVPTLAQTWLMGLPKGPLVRSLRVVFFSGEPLTSKLVESWREVVSDRNEIVNFYGPTETTMIKCFYRVPVNCLPGPQPVGEPMPQTQALILRDRDQLCGIGEIGEIAIRTPFRTLGYINAPEETRQRFVRNPFRDNMQDLIYYTGDLGRYRGDGSIEVLGRIDQQVKLRGIRIEPGEIEAALVEHAGVDQCAVNVWEDRPGEKRLVAYVVASGEKMASSGELRAYLQTKLPDYMIPADFVELRKLPLTANGKLDRRALPQPEMMERELEESAQGLHTNRLIKKQTTFIPPRDFIESQLTQIWEELFNLRPIGVVDSFFELGGHSLLAVSLMIRIEDVFGVKLPLQTLFRRDTIEHIATALRCQGEYISQSILAPIQSRGAERPFFCVHPIGGNVLCYYYLAHFLGPERPFYAFQSNDFDEGYKSFNTIEAMAGAYVKELCKIQPQGPYLLGGWSMGEKVAFEMAQQLLASGEDVALLALFDTTLLPPEVKAQVAIEEVSAEALSQEKVSDALIQEIFLEDLHLHIPLSVRQLPTMDQMVYLIDLWKKDRKLPPDFDLSVALRIAEVIKNNMRAVNTYRMRPYTGKITYFHASEERTYEAEECETILKQFASEVEYYEVPGKHKTLMNKMNAKVLAEYLGRVLSNL